MRARVLGTRAQGFPFCGAAEGTLACGPETRELAGSFGGRCAGEERGEGKRKR
jgi:hypothetical protein